MHTLWQRWQRRRLKKYLQQHPALIAVSGSAGQEIAAAALALALNSAAVKAAPAALSQLEEVAAFILSRDAGRLKPKLFILPLAPPQPGMLDALARELPLTVSIITNVHSVNLHLFSSQDLVAHEQASLAAGLAPESIVCLNHDDRRVADMAQHLRARVVWFGRSYGNDIRLVRWSRLPSLGLAAEFNVRGTPLEIHLPHIVAEHQLTYVAAALAGAAALGGDIKAAAKNLPRLRTSAGHLRLTAGQRGARLLDHSAAGTPESVLAGLAALADMPAKRRIAVIADLDNLGAHTVAWHEEIGAMAGEVADIVVAVGENMRAGAAEALKAAGTDVHQVASSRDVGKWLEGHLKSGDVVYIAGGPAMNMAAVTRRLAAHPEQ